MDFIEKLLFSFSCNTIMVIIDHLSKQAIFVLTVDIINSYELAKLFVIHIFSKHDVLFYITSDYRSKFVSNLFQSLETALNMWLYFTFGYYPKGDSVMILNP